MAALSQGRMVAGSRAFTGLRPRRVLAVSNGAKCTMSGNTSFMVEVNVGEDEPEDIAVRKFMNKVMESRVIEQLKGRRYHETPLENFKRRTKERIERIKMKVIMPNWEEEYGKDAEVKPFAEFFPDASVDHQLSGFISSSAMLPYDQENYLMQSSQGSYLDSGAGNLSTSPWGNYSPPAYRNGNFQGGYMPYQNQGDYMQQPAGGAMGDYAWTAPATPMAQPVVPVNTSVWYNNPVGEGQQAYVQPPQATTVEEYEAQMVAYKAQQAAYLQQQEAYLQQLAGQPQQ